MKLPEGTPLGYINNPLQEKDVQRIIGLVGVIKISAEQGEGVILIDQGKLIAASFVAGDKIYSGNSALEIINATTPGKMELFKYSPDEYRDAVETCEKENLLQQNESSLQGLPDILDESILRKVMAQPGVVAVSAFSEGFSVESLGEADFDQVAAMAEDLLRAGIKIAEDMKIGLIDQIILETGSGKIIVAPYGDLFICVFTKPDANLGLIRIVLKSIQNEIS
jgi:predicted regulator of Ras-like GTPase activity (Roadblock/LC7/MglB family)